MDIILQELSVSKPEYHLELCENSEVRVTILFNTSTLHGEGSPMYLSMTGTKSRSYETAESSACQKAITNVEQATNSFIRDLSYAWLVYVKEICQYLLRTLRKVEEYNFFARGWFRSCCTYVFFLKTNPQYHISVLFWWTRLV